MTTIPTNGPDGANRLAATARGDGASPLGIQAGQGPGLAPPDRTSAVVGPPHLAQPASSPHIAKVGTEAFRAGLSLLLQAAVFHGKLTAAQGRGRLSTLMATREFRDRPVDDQVRDVLTTVTPRVMVSLRSDRDGI